MVGPSGDKFTIKTTRTVSREEMEAEAAGDPDSAFFPDFVEVKELIIQIQMMLSRKGRQREHDGLQRPMKRDPS